MLGGLAEVLADLARSLSTEPDLATTIEAIVKAAVDNIPGAQEAGISLVEKGAVRTVAPTSEMVVTVDRLQYDTGEGPCVDAITDHHIYRTGDLRNESRWSKFAPAAADEGVISMLSYRLFTNEDTLGALNLYSPRKDAFTTDAEQGGAVFAAHAAVALTGAKTEANLLAAMESRDTIGMAKGILMERHDIDPNTAFSLLASSSQHTNMKLHDVAEWLVTNRRQA
jgi:GAF domain-containing protein